MTWLLLSLNHSFIGGLVTISGSIKSVNVANGSVSVAISGQSDVTINGLSSAQATALQSQVGKTYTFSATQNIDGSYGISPGSNPVASSPSASGPNAPPSMQKAPLAIACLTRYNMWQEEHAPPPISRCESQHSKPRKEHRDGCGASPVSDER